MALGSVESFGEIEICAPEAKKDRVRLSEFLAGVFSKNGVSLMKRYYLETVFSGSHYNFDRSLIAKRGEEIVGHVGVFPYAVRFGSAKLSAVGIGSVATAEACRGCGIASTLMEQILKRETADRRHVAVLIGIPRFYEAFGFTPAWPQVDFIVERPSLPSGKGVCVNKTAQSCERDRLWNRVANRGWFAPVRPLYTKGCFSPLPGWATYGMRPEGRSRVVAFATCRVSGDRLEVMDCAGSSEILMKGVAGLIVRKKLSGVCFKKLPEGHELRQWLAGVEHRCEQIHYATGGIMVRGLDAGALGGELEEVFNERLANSPMPAWKGRLVLCGGGREVELRLGKSLRGARLYRVDLGYPVERLLLGLEEMDGSDARHHRDIRLLAPFLFPKLKHHHAYADWA